MIPLQEGSKHIYATLRVAPLGDDAVVMTFGDTISREVASRVRSVADAILAEGIRGVVDVVPAYTTIAVYFDPVHTSRDELTTLLAGLCGRAVTIDPLGEAAGRVVEIPVRYEGPDLNEVAEQTGVSVNDVIERHAAPTYYAYMLGFVPGFAYLGDLDPSLVLPRRTTPRQRVPAGSVAIAGAQTAVYPLVTPGGWHIIGSTALAMFDVNRHPPALIRAGDNVRFVPVRD
ncbi:MAG: 5-oxoprolinase subunit PxpB [Gemmatimonadaceae bacterium]